MPIEVLPEMTIIWPKIESIKRMCIDLDGVVCEYNFPKIVKDFFGINLSSKAIFAYDLADVLGVAPAMINLMFKTQVYGKPNFVEGAIDTLKEWQAKGYELIIYSNRTKYMSKTELEKWLKDNRIPFTSIDGGLESYDVHIDDSPGKLMATNSKLKLLYNQPWNKRCRNITGKLVRMKNWEGVRSYVQAYF